MDTSYCLWVHAQCTYFAALTLTFEKAMSMWLEVRFLPRTPASFAHLLMSIDVASAPLALLANFLKAASMTAPNLIQPTSTVNLWCQQGSFYYPTMSSSSASISHITLKSNKFTECNKSKVDLLTSKEGLRTKCKAISQLMLRKCCGIHLSIRINLIIILRK